jgi:hypothetical protein
MYWLYVVALVGGIGGCCSTVVVDGPFIGGVLDLVGVQNSSLESSHPRNWLASHSLCEARNAGFLSLAAGGVLYYTD